MWNGPKEIDDKIEFYKNQNYTELKTECLQNGTLFEDPVFPAKNSSIFYTKPVPKGVRWMRPDEIVRLNYAPKEPRFVVCKAEANDLDQGYLGNCWYTINRFKILFFCF